jgi:hypothetical protein
MRGFTWLEQPPPVGAIPAGAELWCVRDAICQLMGWQPGSEDHGAFIQLVGRQNIHRLAAHLGLTVFDGDNAAEFTYEVLAHPGAVIYAFEVPGVPDSDPLAHMIYFPDLREIAHRGLPSEYDEYQPEIACLLVDLARPPGARRAAT